MLQRNLQMNRSIDEETEPWEGAIFESNFRRHLDPYTREWSKISLQEANTGPKSLLLISCRFLLIT